MGRRVLLVALLGCLALASCGQDCHCSPQFQYYQCTWQYDPKTGEPEGQVCIPVYTYPTNTP